MSTARHMHRGNYAMYVRGIMTAVALVAATSTATAVDAIVGGVSVKLPPPSGFCELTEREPPDKRMLAISGDLVAKSGNKLHVMSADCKQLSEWRTRRRPLLDDFAQYQTPMSDKPPEET